MNLRLMIMFLGVMLRDGYILLMTIIFSIEIGVRPKEETTSAISQEKSHA